MNARARLWWGLSVVAAVGLACSRGGGGGGTPDGGSGWPDAIPDDRPPLGELCAAAARWIYLVDMGNVLLRYEPDTGTLSPIGVLDCPAGMATPFSMAVDRQATAWVLYSDGAIFHVDVETAACTPTAYVSGQSGLTLFGMGFVSDAPGSAEETLYIAGGPTQNHAGVDTTLASLDTGSLTVATIAPLEGGPELTGNGNAELWGFAPNVTPKRVVELNKASGAVLDTFDVSSIDTAGSGENVLAWAFAFWGGGYYIFYRGANDAQTAIWRLDPGTRDVSLVNAASGYTVVGAGVSTCAPLVVL